MKQHISVEQLNQLSEKGKEKYISFCRKLGLEIERYKEKTNYPLLSIGMMIEFLGDNFVSLNFGPIMWGNWIWTIKYKKKNIIEIQNDELADALWEAVKEVLNE